MIITFGTQKGGVGKTTLAVAFANYLSLYKKKEVKVFDFDFQKSFYNKWKEDDLLEAPKLYDVELITEDDLEQGKFSDEVLNEMEDSDTIYIFDLAGVLNVHYTDIVRNSSVIVIPYEYSEFAIKSTIMFIHYLGHYECYGEKIFVRNRIDKNFNYKNKEEQDKEFSKFGKVLDNTIYKRNCLQHITTRNLEYKQKDAVRKSFEEIIDHINETLQTAI